MGEDVDTDIALETLIETLILKNHVAIYNYILDYTYGEKLYHALLRGVAKGDRRTHSAYKRAHTSEAVGAPALEYLCQSGLLSFERSREHSPQKEYPAQKLKKEVEHHIISDKLSFTMPLMHFWFRFVSPHFKAIQEENYERFFQQYHEHAQGFSSLVFEKLSIEFLKRHLQNDPFKEISSYWERHIEIDVLGVTQKGLVYAGECKFTNTKVNKSELTKLKEKCETAKIEVDIYVLFSKRGFSNELLDLEGKDVLLFLLDDFQELLKDLNEDTLISPLVEV